MSTEPGVATGPFRLRFFFFQAEDGIRDFHVTGVQTCALPILLSPEVELTGDTQVLVRLQSIFSDLQIDGEAALARWLGPVAAHGLGELARGGRNWFGSARQSLERAVGDYLTEEGRQLVGRAEADASAAMIHELRLQLDRLDARLHRLEQPD